MALHLARYRRQSVVQLGFPAFVQVSYCFCSAIMLLCSVYSLKTDSLGFQARLRLFSADDFANCGRWIESGLTHLCSCRRPGQEYTAQDPSGNWWAFNICGMVSYSCIPDGYADPFAHGIAHQYLEGTPQSATTQGGTGCKNPTTDPATGAQTCTSQCIMAAVEEPDYELINPGDVNGGVEIFHAGVAPDADSPFKCPFDPKVGCSGARSMTYYFTCDKNQRNGLGNVYINETSSCQYFIQATTSYACATKGDPFDPYRDNPADSFGFVVLGAFLTVLFQYIYAFGDQRSWWEPIKQRIPAIPGLSGFGEYLPHEPHSPTYLSPRGHCLTTCFFSFLRLQAARVACTVAAATVQYPSLSAVPPPMAPPVCKGRR